MKRKIFKKKIFKKKIFKKKALRNLIISYIAIIFIPLLFGVVIYVYAMKTAEKAVRSIYEHTVYEVGSGLESVMDNLKNISYTLSNSANTNGLSAASFDANSNYALYSSQLQKTIRSYKTANDKVEEIYLYFPKNDYILSSEKTYQYQKIKESGERYLGLTEEKFTEITTASTNGSFYMLEKGASAQLYFIYQGFGFDGKVVVFIPLDMSEIRHIVNVENTGIYLESRASLFWLMGPVAESVTESVQKVRDAAVGQAVEYNGKWWIRLQSEKYGYQLYSVMDGSAYLKKIEILRLILWCYFGLSVMIGGLFIRYFSKKNYSPVSKLLSEIGENAANDLDEFQTISDYYKNVIERDKQSQSQLRESREYVYNSRFQRLLKNADSKNIEQEWRTIREDGKLFLDGNYIMAGIPLTSEGDSDLNCFILENMFTELLGNRYPIVSGNLDGFLILFLHLPNDCEDETEIVNHMGLAVYQIERFGRIKLSVNLSRIMKNVRMANVGLDEIKSLQEYRDLMRQDDIKVRTAQELYFPGEAAYEQVNTYRKSIQLQEMIRKGQFREAEELLQSMQTEQNEKEERGKKKKKEQIVEEITDYIEYHYDDWQLSGKMFAKKYEVSLSYLSQIFKKEKGVGLLDYINHIRYIKAKAMIEDGMSIQEAAQKVGYSTTQPLRRLFLQFEGITPAQVRRKTES